MRVGFEKSLSLVFVLPVFNLSVTSGDSAWQNPRKKSHWLYDQSGMVKHQGL
jgi:hypothetical protein